MKRLLLLLMLVGAAGAQQVSRYDNIAFGTLPGGNILQALPGATIQVSACAQMSTSCTLAANLCSSITDTSCGGPGNLFADSGGNFHFYAKAGRYQVTISAAGFQPRTINDVILPLSASDGGGGGGGVGGGTSVTVNGTAAVPNNLNFTNTLLPPANSTVVQFLLNGNTVGAYVPSGGGGGGGSMTVNGAAGGSDLNDRIPPFPPNGINISWFADGTGHISGAIVGDGIATHCFLGSGVFAQCPGGGGGSATLPTTPIYDLFASTGAGAAQASGVLGSNGFVRAQVYTATGDISGNQPAFQLFPNASVEYFPPPAGYTTSQGTFGAAHGLALYMSHSGGSGASANGGLALGGGNSSGTGNQVYLDCETTGCDFKVPVSYNGGGLGGGSGSLPTTPQFDLFSSTGSGGAAASGVFGTGGFMRASVLEATGTSNPSPFSLPNGSIEYFANGAQVGGIQVGGANGVAMHFSHSSVSGAPGNGGIALAGGNSSGSWPSYQTYLDCEETTGCVSPQLPLGAPQINVNGAVGTGIAMTGVGGSLPVVATGSGGVGIGPGGIPQYNANGAGWVNIGSGGGASSTVSVNGTPVPNPNFANSPSLTWTVSGSNVTGTATGGAVAVPITRGTVSTAAGATNGTICDAVPATLTAHTISPLTIHTGDTVLVGIFSYYSTTTFTVVDNNSVGYTEFGSGQTTSGVTGVARIFHAPVAAAQAATSITVTITSGTARSYVACVATYTGVTAFGNTNGTSGAGTAGVTLIPASITAAAAGNFIFSINGNAGGATTNMSTPNPPGAIMLASNNTGGSSQAIAGICENEATASGTWPGTLTCQLQAGNASWATFAVELVGGGTSGGGGGGGMTWPTGVAGSIPNYNGASAWGTSYNAANPIPANFIATPLSQDTTGNAATATNLQANGTAAGQVWTMLTANTQGWQTPTGGAAPALSSITAASVSHSINNLTFPQTWQWAQTAAGAGMTFNEAAASTGGTPAANGITNQATVNIGTAAASTATPLSITQGDRTGTTAIPAMQVQSLWNSSSTTVERGILFNVTANTSSSTDSRLIDLQVAGTSVFSVSPFAARAGVFSSASLAANTVYCGSWSTGSSLGVPACGGLQTGVVGGATLRGGDNTSTQGAPVGAGMTLIRSGALTTATPNTSAMEGAVEIVQMYIPGPNNTMITAGSNGTVVCPDTNPFTVRECPANPVNMLGIGNPAATGNVNPVAVVTSGTVAVRLPGTETAAIGDLICTGSNPGLGHTNGQAACAAGSTTIGTVIAIAGNIAVAGGTATITATLSPTLPLVQLRHGIAAPGGTTGAITCTIPADVSFTTTAGSFCSTPLTGPKQWIVHCNIPWNFQAGGSGNAVTNINIGLTTAPSMQTYFFPVMWSSSAASNMGGVSVSAAGNNNLITTTALAANSTTIWGVVVDGTIAAPSTGTTFSINGALTGVTGTATGLFRPGASCVLQ